MSTSQATSSAQSSGISIASVRILRLALGTALSLWFSQAVGWQMSFIAPVFTLLVLALPLPVLKLKQGIAFVAVLAVALYSGMLLLPMLLEQPAVGLLLLTLALFWSFYFTAKGGSALIGTFATVGLALVAGVGSVNVDALLIVAGDVVFAAAVGVIFVWIAHALMPDSMAFDSVPMPGNKAPEAPQPDLANARWSAFRSLLIVLPVALFLMLSSSSVAYIAVMIKVASMGQQATNDDTRHARLGNAQPRADADALYAGRWPCRTHHGAEDIPGRGYASPGCHMVIRLHHDGDIACPCRHGQHWRGRCQRQILGTNYHVCRSNTVCRCSGLRCGCVPAKSRISKFSSGGINDEIS
jgi:hypothetical protein